VSEYDRFASAEQSAADREAIDDTEKLALILHPPIHRVRRSPELLREISARAPQDGRTAFDG
jgi:hypothetical protein